MLTLVGPTGIVSSASQTIAMDIAPDGEALATGSKWPATRGSHAGPRHGRASFVGHAGRWLTGMTAVNNVVSLADASVEVPESAGTSTSSYSVRRRSTPPPSIRRSCSP